MISCEERLAKHVARGFSPLEVEKRNFAEHNKGSAHLV